MFKVVFKHFRAHLISMSLDRPSAICFRKKKISSVAHVVVQRRNEQRNQVVKLANPAVWSIFFYFESYCPSYRNEALTVS